MRRILIFLLTGVFLLKLSVSVVQAGEVVLGNGEANGQPPVNSLDIKYILSNWLKNSFQPAVGGDQFGDGKVNAFDFLLTTNVLRPIVTPAASPSPTPIVVPTITPPGANSFVIGQPNDGLFYGPFLGFGAEWDPFFWNINNQSKGLNEADWELILNRVHEAQIPMVRMWTQLYFATMDPDGNVWNFENRRMQSLERHLDFACKNNIDVALTDWGWSFYFIHGSNPTDPKFGQGIAKMLRHLIVDKKYSCIKYFIELNEPDHEGYFSNVSAHFGDYVKMISNIDQGMKDQGIRDKIKFLGPDEACCGSYFVPSLENATLRSIFDGFDFHLYSAPSEIASGGLWWRAEQYRDYVKNYSDNPSVDILKPQIISEAGSTDSVSDSFDHALLMADYGTTILNTKVQSALAWNLFDIWYDQSTADSTSEGASNYQMIPWGQWKYKDSGWSLRPYAQTWGLLSKFAPRNSQRAPVYYPGKGVSVPPPVNMSPNNPPSGSQRVAALMRPDGGWSVFLVNRSNAQVTLSLTMPDLLDRQFDRYQITSGTLAANKTAIIVPPIGVFNWGQNFSIIVPANSFTVLVETAPKRMPAPSPIVIPSPPPPIVSPTLTCIPGPSQFCPPIGKWEFEDGSGNSVMDSSPNHNDGVLNGNVTFSQNGKNGRAISMNGQMGSYVHILNPVMPDGAYSETAWVNFAGSQTDSIIMGSGLGAVNHLFGIVRGGFAGNCGGVSGKLAAGHNGSYCSAVEPSSFPTNSWVHVALTYDPSASGGTLKIYRNGVQTASATNIQPIIDDPFLNIGSWNYRNSTNGMKANSWNGFIDSARLYNYALTASQVGLDMNGQ